VLKTVVDVIITCK